MIKYRVLCYYDRILCSNHSQSALSPWIVNIEGAQSSALKSQSISGFVWPVALLQSFNSAVTAPEQSEDSVYRNASGCVSQWPC